MPELKPGTMIPADEDAVITDVALSDPDAQPLTEAEWESVNLKRAVECLESRSC